MKRAPSLASVMTPFPHAIAANADVAAAGAMMKEHDVHHLPVMRGDDLVGVVSAADVALVGSLEGGDVEVAVAAVCTSEPFVIDIHTRLAAVVAEMAERRLGSALVTRHDKLVGILTHADVSRVLAQALHDLSGDATGDDDVA